MADHHDDDTSVKPKPPISRSLGGSSRINDHMLAFGLRLFTAKDYGKPEEALWVWYASHGCNGKPLAKIVDVSVEDLRKMRDVIDGHIKMIEADKEYRSAQPA